MNDTYDVFISYSHKDLYFAQSLTQLLREKGINVWFDKGQLRIGDSMLSQIESALENSRFYLLLISPDFPTDQWQSFEMGVSLSRSFSGDSRILPLYIRGGVNKSALPSGISNLQGMDVEKLSMEYLVSKITEIVQKDKKGKLVCN